MFELVHSKGSSSIMSFVLLVVGLLIGGGGAYIFVSNTYQPIMDDYENQLSDYSSQVSVLSAAQDVLESDKLALEAQSATLENDVSALESDLNYAENQVLEYESDIFSLGTEISSLESQVSTLTTQKSSLESQVSTLTTQKSSLESQVSTFQSTLTQKNNLIDDLKNDINDLEADIASISGIVVTQHYEWDFGSGYSASEYSWDLPISLGTYLDYFFMDRPTAWDDWVDMVNDPGDDFYITSMVQKINEAAIREGMSEVEKVNFVIDFVQSLPYTEDSVTTDWNEYPRYPMETLFDRGGDCEDTSILVAALLERLGYEVCLIFPVDKNHCAVGVAFEGAYGTYYDHEGTKYYYLETTGEGWEIGDMPSDYEGSRAYIYPINP